jgi:ABC-2 type transport system permease protein
MRSLQRAFADSSTMFRRDLRHAARYPMVTISGLMTPVVILLLFDGVFGHALRGGIGPAIRTGHRYVDYLTPGVLLMAAGGVAEATALTVNTDMSEGVIARFRTMPIWRPSVLAGRVAGSLARTLATGVVLLAVAVGLGFRPSASPLEWLAVAGMFALVGLALTWLTVSFGLLAKTPAGANSLSLIPLFLPFISSAFVPTRSMPAGVRFFAANQPFTPIIDTIRGLLTGGPIGSDVWLAVGWCGLIASAGYLWSMSLYNRAPRS